MVKYNNKEVKSKLLVDFVLNYGKIMILIYKVGDILALIKTKMHDITEYVWEPDSNPLGVIHIIHGMAEHLKRYNGFASYMNDNGFVVCGIDLPGHGESIVEAKGFFAEENGKEKVVDAVLDLNKRMKEQYRHLHFICFGHSMGAFFAEYIAAKHPEQFDSYIFCGTSGKNNLLFLAKLIAGWEIRKKGNKNYSTLLNKLSFGSYNKSFRPNVTEFDWLSGDPAEVKKYVDDELCGFVFTSSGFYDVFEVMDYVSGIEWLRKIDKNKRYLLISGALDPVGKKGRSVKKYASGMKKAGVRDVVVKIYEGKRHELLNEVNKEHIYIDILAFARGDII